VTGVEGADGAIETLRWTVKGQETERAIRHLFLFIGADPNTDWLADSGVELDAKGFVVTGEGGSLQTSLPGVFAIGDVRAGSVKRVAAAVGEGAQVVAAVHKFLGSQAPATA
jgi:thioredoxin reductase (NADPH)